MQLGSACGGAPAPNWDRDYTLIMTKCAYLYSATREVHLITDIPSRGILIVAVLTSTTFVTLAQVADQSQPAQTSVERLVKMQRSWGCRRFGRRRQPH